MKINDVLSCKNFPCKDINNNSYLIPDLDLNPDKIRIVMISEVPPIDSKDYFYSNAKSFYMETTKQAFNESGHLVNSIQDILNLGVYITTAVKCGKIGSSISIDTIKECSFIDRKSTRLNSSHSAKSRMPSSA